jgi:predicted Rossmann fold nucleotide-binding protein DprA/Smf involved in DNA uptake
MDFDEIRLDAGGTAFFYGNERLLANHKIGVLASRKCPAATILEAHNRFKELAAENRTIVSGFHSPLEQECLRLLLRDGGNIVFCVARGLEKMRIKKEWRNAIEEDRMLIVSQCKPSIDHITKEQTKQRNRLVVQISDELYTPYVQPGGSLAELL